MSGVEIRAVRDGVMVAVVDGVTVASVARVHGSVPERWVGHVRGSRTYVVDLSELSARDWLVAQAQTGRADGAA